MAYNIFGVDVGSTPELKEYMKDWLLSEGYYETGAGQYMTNSMAVDMDTGGAVTPGYVNLDEWAANPYASGYSTMTAALGTYLNTYYKAATEGETTGASNLLQTGGTLPASYVSSDTQTGGWTEGPVDMYSGGQGVYDPNLYAEDPIDPTEFYKEKRAGAWRTSDWESTDWADYMGDETTPGAGKWEVGGDGKLTWVASSPVQNSPHRNFFQQTFGPFADIITTVIPTIIGQAVGSGAGPIGQGFGGAMGNFLGQLITDNDITHRGGPNFASMAAAAVMPNVVDMVSDLASSAWNAIPSTATTTAAATAASTAADTAAETAMDTATETAMESVADASSAFDSASVLNDITPTVDVGEASAVESVMGTPMETAAEYPDQWLDLRTVPDDPTLWETVKATATSPNTWEDVADLGLTGLSLASGLSAANPDLPALPELLTLGTAPEQLAAHDYTMPELPSWEMPEDIDYPDVEWPDAWDTMTDDEKQEWLIQRGGEAAKRRKGTYAGNLLGIRGGGTDASLAYGELSSLDTAGKQLLGA